MRAVVLIAAVALFALSGAASAGRASVASQRGTSAYLGATSPSWSPDGKQIAFVEYHGLNKSRIVRAPAAGGGAVRTVSAASIAGPILWAAGGRIVFLSNFAVRSVPVQGGRARELFSSTWWFVLSPNRKTVAAADGCGCKAAPDAIAFVAVRGGSPRVVPKPADANDEIENFSPGGKQLVFSRAPFSADGPLFAESVQMAIRLSGGQPVPLAQSGIPGAALVPNDARQVQWSSNGRWVAFVEGLKLEVEPTAGGSAPRVLATHFGSDRFSWSPRSTSIAYDCCSNRATQRLMTVRPNGTHRSVLTKGKAADYAGSESGPQWSPNGSRIAFAASRPLPGVHPDRIWTIRPNGRGLTLRGN